MALPTGFRWIRASQHDNWPPRALVLHDVWVAVLIDKVDGGWFARLECQLPFPNPLVTVPCASFEQGKRGVEIWAARHEARLREEVAATIARRPLHPAVPVNDPAPEAD